MNHNIPKHAQHLTAWKQQSGAVMAISLIMLLLLTLIGITGSQVTGLSEKMSGNMRDRNIAFQAAESALRDAEHDITNAVAAAARDISGISDFSPDCGASTVDDSDDGLCYNGSNGFGLTVIDTQTPSIWDTANMSAAPSVAFGRFTNATAIPNLSAQPRYLIEVLRRQSTGCGHQSNFFRITVRAQGTSANSVVWLQEVYKPDHC
ncbi:MAG: PilX N-terminal domain-containing pilus assembly protein [Methylovulum sp.]|nr:PilX N-terminal domain-containing pilus assembly protein [Methylovulum sp.]